MNIFLTIYLIGYAASLLLFILYTRNCAREDINIKVLSYFLIMSSLSWVSVLINLWMVAEHKGLVDKVVIRAKKY